MTKNNREEIDEEQALKDFLVDIKCLDELLPWTEKFNIFDVLKITRQEIRHSNMLSWLLDPNENHGLGDEFLRRMIQKIFESNEKIKNILFKAVIMDLYSFRVLQEWNHIDILLTSESEKLVIAIENKVGSHEHDNQLERYRDILNKHYLGYDKILVYLTPGGEKPSDFENWNILTYNDVVEVLEEIYPIMNVSPDVELMIRNYIEVIRRDIVEDKQLIEICNKIYNKHKKALDLIYENRIDKKVKITDAIENVLLNLNDEGGIMHSEEYVSCVFQTEKMSSILPDFEEAISSWGSTNYYAYWFDVEEDRCKIVFELAGLNVSAKHKKMMNKIISVLKPRDKNPAEFKCKRVYQTKWYNFNDVNAPNFEREIEKIVRQAIDDIKNMEDELFEKIFVKKGK